MQFNSIFSPSYGRFEHKEKGQALHSILQNHGVEFRLEAIKTNNNNDVVIIMHSEPINVCDDRCAHLRTGDV